MLGPLFGHIKAPYLGTWVGKNITKLMDLTIPMGQKDHSKKIVGMVKRHE
jgi:hypothetical protein